ncbi:PRKAB2 [Branchiostoma lanceolatum]|uniref:5'-AMP-activated protein kinase subunit beta-1 n=1 Tax=Branchiostoma lanceolatum TaxID=7740 RepID=A0A8J9Z4P0_BRALA|nr:PRKAB2 [Branchiostoma lanceolatum]
MTETTQKSSPLPSEASSAVKPEITDSVAVKLVLDGDIADDVVLRGSWDGWSKDWDLARNKKTLENSVCLNLPCRYYEYKYRGGRRWFCDKSKPMVPNVFGTLNNYMEVKKVPEKTPSDETVMAPKDIVDKIQDTTTTQAPIPRESVENLVRNADEKFEEISSTETPPEETIRTCQDRVDKIQDTSVLETPLQDKTTEKTSINIEEKIEVDPDAALDVPQISEEMATVATLPKVEIAGKGLSEIVDTASSETTAHVDTSAAVASVAQMAEELVTVITSSPIESEEGEHDVTIVLPVGSHEYKYRIGNSWFHDHTKPTMLNAFGTLNNILKIRRADKKLKEDIPLEVIMRDETPDASGLSMEQNIQDSETTDAQASDEPTGEGETAEKNVIDIIQEVKVKLQSESMFVPTAADFAEESADKDPIDDLPPEEILQNILSDLAERTEDNIYSQPEK